MMKISLSHTHTHTHTHNMDDNIDLQVEEEAEETLSLSDFPIITDDQLDCEGPSKFLDHRSSSESTELFEFNDLTSEMSHAEDIIFCGKLLNFNEQPLSNQTHNTINKYDQQKSFHCRRSESLSELKTSQSNRAKSRLMRNSRSLDSQNLRRTLSTNSETSVIHRNPSSKSFGKSDNPGQKVSKPRWYVLMFGIVKFPPEMELKDIKTRQVRQTPATMFPPFDASRELPVSRCHRKSSWSLLRVLSCKGHASVVATVASHRCEGNLSRATWT